MPVRFEALPSAEVSALRAGAPDAYGNLPERRVSPGAGVPCRHCLHDVPAGEEMLVLAHRPFPSAQPYAETGPIFLCAGDCAQGDRETLPPRWDSAEKSMLLKAYGADGRLRYGEACIVPGPQIAEAAEKLLEEPQVAFVDARFALTNCFQFRMRRA